MPYINGEKFSMHRLTHLSSAELDSLNFHTTSPQNEPFFVVNLELDMMQHALPNTILQSQPKLGERQLHTIPRKRHLARPR